jgi:hypothetical protein
LGQGTLSLTFPVVPAPSDYLGAHGVVDAVLVPVDGGPNVTFHPAF